MILGIDFSLAATGVCAITDGEAECVTIGSKKEETWDRFPGRVNSIVDQIVEWAEPPADVTVVIESPAFTARSSSLDRMFGGWWLAVAELQHHLSDPPLLVTPTQVKKFATGKGNAGKDEVILATARRFPDVDVRDNNQTDALQLAAIGAAAMREPFNQGLTKAQEQIVADIRGKGRN